MPRKLNTENFESYLRNGCGRCDRGYTPECKVHRWTDALVELRRLVDATELTEEMKWGTPTYTLNGNNVVQIVSRLDYCSLAFFKGSLLTDATEVLIAPGPNSQAVRLFNFETKASVQKAKKDIVRFLAEAIALEKAGKEVVFKQKNEPVPPELQAELDADVSLAEAFAALTRGRQRSHILHISGAKQAATRVRRVQKCAEKIRAGKGFNER